MGLKGIIIIEDYSALPPAQEQISINWCTGAPYGCVPELVVENGIKHKIIMCKYVFHKL